MKVHFLMKKMASTLGTRGFFSHTSGSFVSSAEGRRHERRCLRADVSYFLCCTWATKEIGDVCTQARAAKPREKTSSTHGKWHLNKQEKIWYRRWSKRRPGRLFNLKGSTEISLVENSSQFLFSWKFVINDNIIPSVKRDIVVASQDIRDFKIQRRDGNENVA